jgi:predicted RNase H-like nuclease
LACGWLAVDILESKIYGINSIIDFIARDSEIEGITIDAPLIIENTTGQRQCDNEIDKEYGTKGASCHTSNKSIYSSAANVYLSENLQTRGYEDLASNGWKIECYPHPAII